MIRVALLASSMLAACGGGGGAAVDSSSNGDSGSDIPQVCIDAETHSDLTWIQENIFSKQCTFSGCHNGAAGDAGKMDLRAGMSHASVVGVAAKLCPTAGISIVTAGHPESSYMMVMLGVMTPEQQTPPSCTIDPTVGEMPQGNPTVLLCSQKQAAIQRWIAAGALDN